MKTLGRRSSFVLILVIILLLVLQEWGVINLSLDDLNFNAAPSPAIPEGHIGIMRIEDGYPATPSAQGEVFAYSGFHLSFNAQHRQANWVAYILTAEMVRKEHTEREDYFTKAPNVGDFSAVTTDYTSSGYDRGHLVPADDMDWSDAAMEESFYMSNVSPQVPGLNRGIWKALENDIRQWALANDSLYVVAGPFWYRPATETIGENKVSVPAYFYKIVVDISHQDGYKGIAFLMPNRDLDGAPFDYSLSIDKLEEQTGYDFFPASGNVIEAIEKQTDKKLWQ